MIPLTIAPVAKELKILKIITDDKTKHHLDNLGILVGATLTNVSAANGNMIVKIKEGKVAVNKELASKIYVNV